MTWNHKPAEEKPYISLICNPYEDKSSTNTRITIDVMEKDLGKDEMIEVLETFMKSMGYHFLPGEHLGIEWEKKSK